MPFPKIQITKKKDGRHQAWFRDSQGRVRTSNGSVDWTRADKIREVAEYGIQLQKEQAAAGIGSDGAPMPPLKGSGTAIFVARVNGKAQFARRGYPQQKAALGLNPTRDLRGPGKDGHMLDDIRVNYLDDRQATIAITRKVSRDKARGNEQKAPWWGWTSESVRKLTAKAAEVFQTGTAEYLFAMGLIGVSALAEAKRLWRKVA